MGGGHGRHRPPPLAPPLVGISAVLIIRLLVTLLILIVCDAHNITLLTELEALQYLLRFAVCRRSLLLSVCPSVCLFVCLFVCFMGRAACNKSYVVMWNIFEASINDVLKGQKNIGLSWPHFNSVIQYGWALGFDKMDYYIWGCNSPNFSENCIECSIHSLLCVTVGTSIRSRWPKTVSYCQTCMQLSQCASDDQRWDGVAIHISNTSSSVASATEYIQHMYISSCINSGSTCDHWSGFCVHV